MNDEDFSRGRRIEIKVQKRKSTTGRKKGVGDLDIIEKARMVVKMVEMEDPELLEQQIELRDSISDAIMRVIEQQGFQEDLDEPEENVGLRRFVERHVEDFTYTLLMGFIKKV